MSASTEQIIAARHETHGDYGDTALMAQGLKDALRHGAGWSVMAAPHREALELIATKLARIVTGDASFKDHWDDVAGYAKLIADRCGK